MNTKTCPCGTAFDVTARNQKYCPDCREAREQAAIAARTVACKDCGEVTYCTYGICEDCHAARDTARRADDERIKQRKIERFGACPQHPHLPASHDGVCVVCHSEIVKERRKREVRARLAAQREQEEQRRDSQRSDEQHHAVYVAMRAAVAELGITVSASAESPAAAIGTNPEQIPADNQDDVDAAFRSLMGGLDL